MKDKYVESRFPIWFDFGTYPNGLQVDIADHNGDVALAIPVEQANTLIARHNRTVAALADAVRRLSPDEQTVWLESNSSEGTLYA